MQYMRNSWCLFVEYDKTCKTIAKQVSATIPFVQHETSGSRTYVRVFSSLSGPISFRFKKHCFVSEPEELVSCIQPDETTGRPPLLYLFEALATSPMQSGPGTLGGRRRIPESAAWRRGQFIAFISSPRTPCRLQSRSIHASFNAC